MGSDNINKDPEKLGSAIKTNEIANTLNFDLDKSLESILKAAARSVGSEEASIIVKNEDGNLFFLKAIGEVGDQLEGVEIPAGKGIAGFVAMSGQPMAISDVGQEESFYAEIDKKTGFSTEILLATPLFFDGEVIGVLEFINRTGNPPFEPFTPEEMDRAAIYAEAIGALANALLASRMSTELAARICEGSNETNVAEIRDWIGALKGSSEHKELIGLAVLLKEVADKGPAERNLCKNLLESILKFAGEGQGIDYSDV
jgi:signal transduction protein with GAF and PtsI domain